MYTYTIGTYATIIVLIQAEQNGAVDAAHAVNLSLMVS